MRFFGCNSCLCVIKVYGQPDELRRLIYQHPMWKDGWPCVTDGCPGPLEELEKALHSRVPNAVEQGLMRQHQLTAEEFFRALCGYGMPDELGTEPEVVTALLLSSSIINLRIRKSPSGRTILDRLDMANGLSIHLASSGLGPTVFKVTRRRDESAAVDDDLREVRQDPEGDGVPGEDQRGQGDVGAVEERTEGGRGGSVEDQQVLGDDGGDHPPGPRAAAGVPEREADPAAGADPTEEVFTGPAERL